MTSVQNSQRKSRSKKQSAEQAIEQMKIKYNHQVLAYHDPKLAHIFSTSCICNVYKFDVEEEKWEKLDCQGTLFVYSRQQQMNENGEVETDPYPYGVMVLNRTSLENFSLGITPTSIANKLGIENMEVTLDDPFIMIATSSGEMFGLWLFYEPDRNSVEQMIQWCLNANI